jgi:mRNA-degrading endonuclease RelE of RelBE toxin-antitoxin system
VTIIMTMRRTFLYRLVYAPQVNQHLKAIEPKYYSLIRKEIEKQLRYQPAVETRNRKPLKRPASLEGDWELRLGPDNRFRVFYEVDEEHREVKILAVGFKDGSRLFIGGEEIEL